VTRDRAGAGARHPRAEGRARPLPPAAIQAAIDSQTKPPGSLGQLEPLMARIAASQRSLKPELGRPHMLVFAADHGVAQAGVSAYPRAVTAQMVGNFAAGGAAINVLCRAQGIALSVVDAGVDWDGPPPGVVAASQGRGTANFLHGPAMTPAAARRAMRAGAALVSALPAADRLIGFGEMGIGNTTSAAALLAALLGLPAAAVVGRGTGVDDAGLARKRAVIRRALALHAGADSLAALGGFEIAMMAGAMAQAARQGRLVVVDGFVATAAWAAADSPALRAHSIFAHVSAERAHRAVLARLGVTPLLDLGMRLGEGSGAALAIPIIQAAAALLREMASFDSAGISRG